MSRRPSPQSLEAEQQQSGPPPAYLPSIEQEENPPPYPIQTPSASPPFHWLRLCAWFSYAAVVILLTVALVPGSWDPNEESWKPTRGLEIFSFEINLDGGVATNSTIHYRTLEQIVVTLSSTCVTPETTIHGGGTCSSNLTPPTWSIHTIRPYGGSRPSSSYFDLPFDAPVINARAIFVLSLLPILISLLIMVALMLGLGCSGRVTHKDGTPKTKVSFRHSLGCWARVWPYVILGALSFLLILVAAILLHVQVSRTVSALKLASEDERYRDILYTYDKPVEEDSRTFWSVLWASVALMAVNPIMLALDGCGKGQWPL